MRVSRYRVSATGASVSRVSAATVCCGIRIEPDVSGTKVEGTSYTWYATALSVVPAAAGAPAADSWAGPSTARHVIAMVSSSYVALVPLRAKGDGPIGTAPRTEKGPLRPMAVTPTPT